LENGPLQRFIGGLRKLKYPEPNVKIVCASDYGAPQRRPRLILIASKFKSLDFPERPSLKEYPIATVRDWIGDLPILKAGERDPIDPDHEAAKLSDRNLLRIKHTPEGGNRRSWPPWLRLKCHAKMISESGKEGHTDVYGRLSYDKPASGLTTKCLSYSNGRFGHPIQDRAISLREAACLQTFPRDFRFEGPLVSRARQVGNAVPPLLAEKFGKLFLEAEKERALEMKKDLKTKNQKKRS
jgi:DNA (cytosine-5)-methyltransferase 1